MNKRIIYISIAALLVITITVLINTYGSTDDSHKITLPSPTAQSSGNIGDDKINRIEVTPETVKSVLETLSRAESFSRTYSIKTYWDGGESESTLNLWRKGENIRLSISQNNTVRNILVLGNDLYIWYGGSSVVFQSKLSESSVNKEIDKFSRLVTYEDIFETPVEDILNAGYLEQSGQACIFAEYKSGNSDYVNQIYVSIDSGLLVSLSRYDGEKLINSMASVSTELSTPSDDVFEIPS